MNDLSELREFIQGYAPKDGSFIRDNGIGFDFDRFVELCKDCADGDIMFTLNFWRTDRKKWVTIRRMDADEVVEALFEKLELYGWIVNAIQYVDGKRVGGVIQKDNCTMWLSDGDDPYGRQKRH